MMAVSDVILSNRDLMVGVNQVNLGKDGFTSQIGCIILNMQNKVAIRSCDIIQPVVVSTWGLFTSPFWGHVEWRDPCAGGWVHNSQVEEFVELSFGSN